MHELSIAQSVVEAAVRAIEHLSVTRVHEVRLAVGALSGVASEALLFSYDVVTAGTPLEGSRLVIRAVAVAVHCPTCRRDVELPDIQSFRCPVCGTPTGDVRRGREIDLESVELETAEDGDTNR